MLDAIEKAVRIIQCELCEALVEVSVYTHRIYCESCRERVHAASPALAASHRYRHSNRGVIATHCSDAGDNGRARARRYRASENGRKKLLELAHCRRAIKAGADGTHTAEEFEAVCKEFDYRCAYCSRSIEEVGRITEDHMTPLIRGGSNFIDNMVPACSSCNDSKGAKTVEEYLEYLEQLSAGGGV